MESGVFPREDIAAILAAVSLSVAATTGNSPHDAAYRRGVAVALAAMATALHIAPGEIGGRLRAAQAMIADDVRPMIEA